MNSGNRIVFISAEAALTKCLLENGRALRATLLTVEYSPIGTLEILEYLVLSSSLGRLRRKALLSRRLADLDLHEEISIKIGSIVKFLQGGLLIVTEN